MTLATRLRRARRTLQDWRRALFDSHVNQAGPHKGKVTDAPMLLDLARYDEAIAAVTEAIREAARAR